MSKLSSSRAYALALAGALGGLFGLYLYTELIRTSSLWIRDTGAGILIGGLIGFFLNGWEPFRDRAWLKLGRESSIGALFGAIGGALGLFIGEQLLGVFQGGLIGRAISWAILGLGIGVSQGMAYRSIERLRYGLIGGGLGGLIGGFFFEALRQMLGHRSDISQGLGIVILGAGLGLCLALVEQVLRRAWVQVQNGRQEGRVYLLARPICSVGLNELADIGLFGDLSVSRQHAEIVLQNQAYHLKCLEPNRKTTVNGQALTPQESRALKDGDRIELGNTRLQFHQRS